MSDWRDERNAASLIRLRRSVPAAFPAGVLAHALARPFVPPTARRAVESYWRAHPVRADRLARALARRGGKPDGWTWRLEPGARRTASFRTPPAPFREPAFARGPGHCCVCGQPVYRFGWHRDLWGDGRPNRNATWHAACVVAWKFWCAPADHDRALRVRQKRRCAETGTRLWKDAEVDHRVPLFEVWRDRRDLGWPDLLAFWGVPNLGVVNRVAHRSKCNREAGNRADARQAGTRQAGVGRADGTPRSALADLPTPVDRS